MLRLLGSLWGLLPLADLCWGVERGGRLSTLLLLTDAHPAAAEGPAAVVALILPALEAAHPARYAAAAAAAGRHHQDLAHVLRLLLQDLQMVYCRPDQLHGIHRSLLLCMRLLLLPLL